MRMAQSAFSDPAAPRVNRRTQANRETRVQSGQTLAEFAIVVPVFLLFVIGLVEFAFAFNADLTTNYASRAGGLVAAEAGNQGAADCLILNAVEQSFSAPADATHIAQIDIQRTNASGATVYATSSYRRGGSLSCTRTDGTTLTVPYSATSSGYPAAQRCNVVGPTGCPLLSPVRTTVDTVAVQITYDYPWHTPLSSLMRTFGGSIAGSGFTFVERNVFRMEPVL
jgi:Flp pilus assembly protein TadG